MVLTPRHRLTRPHGSDLHLSFLLCDGADRTAARQGVLPSAPRYAVFLPYFPPGLQDGVPVQERHEDGQAAHEATVSNSLCRLAVSVARQEVRHDADTAVAETAEQALFPLAHYDLLLFQVTLTSNNMNNSK